MPYTHYFGEQLSEHLFVVGQAPAGGVLQTIDCHIYLIEGETSVLAVDAGGGKAWPFVKAMAERHGFADKPISHVLVTHGHGDHARGLTELEAQGALTCTSVYTSENLDSAEDADMIFDHEGVHEVGEFAPQVLFTPGHTPGCISYRLSADGKLCLFTGDLIRDDGNVGWSGHESFSQAQILASLKKLATLAGPDWLLTGHSYIANGRALLDKAIAYGERGQWIPWTTQAPRMPAG
jgi:hydroxyacylglutathione hydrolase